MELCFAASLAAVSTIPLQLYKAALQNAAQTESAYYYTKSKCRMRNSSQFFTVQDQNEVSQAVKIIDDELERRDREETGIEETAAVLS